MGCCGDRHGRVGDDDEHMNERPESGGQQGEGEQARKEAGVYERIEEAPSGELLDVHGPFELADELAGRPSPGAGGGALRGVVSTLNALVSVVLNVVAAKPISIFVWWLYAGGNRTTFHGRGELARRVARARMAGCPVLFAANHPSMFDDPVVRVRCRE